MSTCGAVLAKLLQAHGVRCAFGIPGVHNAELYRGLGGSGIRHVSPRHEQGAGFMADGYARASGRPAAVFVISGPGVTNVATALGQAYADSVPLLLIAAAPPRRTLGFGRGVLHDLKDQRGLLAGLTASTQTIERPDDLPDALARAFAVFACSRPRPVAIEIPIDVLEQPFAGNADLAKVSRLAAPGPDPEALRAIAARLREAPRVVVMLGGGVRAAAGTARTLVEQLAAPTMLTTNARGLLPSDHPLLAEFVVATDAGRALLDKADVILAVGTEMGETDYDFYARAPFPGRPALVRIDIDPQQIAIGPRVAAGLVADAGLACAALVEALAPGGQTVDHAWTASFVAEARMIMRTFAATLDTPAGLFGRIARTIAGALDAPILIGDSTQPFYHAMLTYRAPGPRRFFGSATGFGTLGYALPAAIGARIACPERPVVALVGDGGLQFSLPELASAIDAQAGIVVVVWNNGGYREIRDFMVRRGIAPVGVDLTGPGLADLGRTYGVPMRRPASLDAFADCLREASRQPDTPTLIELGPWLEA